MKTMTDLLADSPIAQLLQPENFVGWIAQLDYDTALVMTNDLWKERALGIPQNCFLVATALDPADLATTRPEAYEIILLRVIGSAKLPKDENLLATKVDHLQDQEGPTVPTGGRDLDSLTRNQLQFSGLTCRVLGTFYQRDGDVLLGSDLESYAAAMRLQVYRPRGAALEYIVNYISPTQRIKAQKEAEALGLQGGIDPFPIGTVRYTSTERLHRRPGEQKVPVLIQPSDLLARRTAVLGMTRTGKSNFVKQMVSVVKRVADKGGVPIGQLIYDLNGEYANANQQDQGALADVFASDTLRYRLLRTAGFRELKINFYQQLADGFEIIQQVLGEQGRATSDYIKAFLSLSLDEPPRTDAGEHTRWQIKIAAYQTLLFAAGFGPPDAIKVKFAANEQVRQQVNQQLQTDGESTTNPTGGLTLGEALAWFKAARTVNKVTALRSSSGKPWVDDELSTLLNMIAKKGPSDGFISGSDLLRPVADYHSPRRTTEVGEEVYQALCDGRIVILDLSVGPAGLRDRLSTRIATQVFERSMTLFVEGKTPPNIVIYVEEAHNLIGKDQKLTETWPRLAKEGAKYRLALVYATQEVSSIHPNILSNTENWFITHLNNDREIKELARFYDFDDFSKSLLRAQDVGFARVKTLSSPFVIPVQIDLFDPQRPIGGMDWRQNARSMNGRDPRTTRVPDQQASLFEAKEPYTDALNGSGSKE